MASVPTQAPPTRFSAVEAADGYILTDRWPKLNADLLAEELAARLRPAADIWLEHGVTTRADAEEILAVPMVMQMIEEAKARWLSAGNSEERIKLRARMSVEKSITGMHRSVNNPLLPLNHRTEALKLLARLGAVDNSGGMNGGSGGGGVGVQIVIDLSRGGGDVHRVVAGNVLASEVE